MMGTRRKDMRVLTVARARTRGDALRSLSVIAARRERHPFRPAQVPGSYELPFGAKCLIESSRVDAVITVGCLIKGDTMHFEYIAEAVTQVCRVVTARVGGGAARAVVPRR